MHSNTHIQRNSFKQTLEFGQVAESKIARFLYRRGCSVLPVYEIEGKRDAGPQLFTANMSLVAPDMLAFNATGDCFFVEAKHKSHFSWHRKTQSWQTGIDQHHFDDYLKVQAVTATPVWLLFLHCLATPWRNDVAHGSPSVCPTGLFGREVTLLREGRRDNGHGSRGMIYWNASDLLRICGPDELCGSDSADQPSSQ